MLKPQPTPPIPEATARATRAARTAFRKGNCYITLRDELGTIFSDDMFTHLFHKLGQPAEAPWRLALVLIVQQIEGLSDRDVADAVRDRLALKYLLSLEQVGKEGLPAIRLTAIEFRLDHVASGVRDLKENVRDLQGDVRGSTNRLTAILGLCTGLITLAIVLSQLFIP